MKLSDFRRHARLSADTINALEPRKERRMNAEGAHCIGTRATHEHFDKCGVCTCMVSTQASNMGTRSARAGKLVVGLVPPTLLRLSPDA